MNQAFIESEVGLETALRAFEQVGWAAARVVTHTEGMRNSALSARADGLGMLLGGVSQSSLSLMRLGTHPVSTDECFMVGRALLERNLNLAFLAVADDEDYAGFLAHALQKSWRRQSVESGPPGMRMALRRQGVGKLEDQEPEVQKAVEQFTSRKGRPKNWTDLTFDQRVATIAERAPACVPETYVLGRIYIYDRASEALHGSLAGLQPSFLGRPQPDEDVLEGMMRARRADLCVLLYTLGQVGTSTLRVLAAIGEQEVLRTQVDAAKLGISEFEKTMDEYGDAGKHAGDENDQEEDSGPRS